MGGVVEHVVTVAPEAGKVPAEWVQPVAFRNATFLKSGGTVIAEVDGTRGVYEVSGQGPPAVLLASPVARAETYRPTAAHLARTFRVFTVGLPGCGGGDRLRPGWSVGRYAGWVAGFIDALGVGRPLVIGHSHAAAVGVVLAARFPDRVGRLVIADGTGTGPHPVGPTVAGGLYDLALDAGLVARAWHHVVGNLVRHTANFRRQVRDSLAGDVRADAGRIPVPVLVAWGRRDHTFPPRHAAEFARLLPDARVYLSTAGSHDWIITRSGEFAAAVTAFARLAPRECGRPSEPFGSFPSGERCRTEA